MEKVFGQNDPKIMEYAERVFHPEDETLKDVRQRSCLAGLPEIQVSPMDGLHLEILARACQAKKIVEIGTLGGYSGICLCRGMVSDGTLYTLEINSTNAGVAQQSFEKAGYSASAKILLGPAIETLSDIKKLGPFDLVFIDADKINYPYYLDWAAAHLRVGGLVVADNTFAFGQIADDEGIDSSDGASLKALRIYNEKAATDPRFRSTILPTGEGLTVTVKIR
jgi:caffeoyl-CoA O-methyltransferase